MDPASLGQVSKAFIYAVILSRKEHTTAAGPQEAAPHPVVREALCRSNTVARGEGQVGSQCVMLSCGTCGLGYGGLERAGVVWGGSGDGQLSGYQCSQCFLHSFRYYWSFMRQEAHVDEENGVKP